MRVIYIAGPYRAATPREVELNIRMAETAMHDVVQLGLYPMCPHTMTRYFDGTGTDQYWLDATLAIMERCDAVYMVPGWQRSEGSRAEYAAALAQGMPVYEKLTDLTAMVAAINN